MNLTSYQKGSQKPKEITKPIMRKRPSSYGISRLAQLLLRWKLLLVLPLMLLVLRSFSMVLMRMTIPHATLLELKNKGILRIVLMKMTRTSSAVFIIFQWVYSLSLSSITELLIRLNRDSWSDEDSIAVAFTIHLTKLRSLLWILDFWLWEMVSVATC